MIYKVKCDTSFGRIDFYWRGGRIVEIYQGDDSTPQLLNPFNLDANRLPFRPDMESFKDFCRWYLWEMERGLDLLTIEGEEIFTMDRNHEGNESPS